MRQGPHAAERSARLRSRGCWASPLVLLLAAACGPDLNGATHVTSRMRIHTSFEAGLCTGDLVDLERYVGSVEMLLGVEMDAPVEVYLWDSFLIPEGCGAERTGCYRRGAHAVYATFDSIYHELAHAVTASLGRPDDFFLEGIAAALDGKISRFPAIDPAVQLHERSDHRDTYAVEAHFTNWLLDSFGATKWRELYIRGGSERDFLKTIGISFDEARSQYLATSAWIYPPLYLRDIPPLPTNGDGWSDTVEFDCSQEDAFGQPDGISIARALSVLESGYYDFWTSADVLVIRRRAREKIETREGAESATLGDVPIWSPSTPQGGVAFVQGGTLSALHLDVGEYDLSVFDGGWDLDSADVIVVPHRGPIEDVHRGL